MKTTNDGGPAFPTFRMVEEYSDSKMQYVPRPHEMSGMSLRDYFAAHAPRRYWRHYQPTMPPCPEPDWTGIPESARDLDLVSPNNFAEIAAWRAERDRQYDSQWPYFYADAILLARDAANSIHRGEQ